MMKPATLLEHPQYVHEYGRRAQYILAQLTRLKEQVRADRVYVLTYEYGMSRFGYLSEKIAKEFEAGTGEATGSFRQYFGLPRAQWLQFKSLYLPGSHIFTGNVGPREYGLELFNHHGRAIAYLGVEYAQENSRMLNSNIWDLIKEMSTPIKASFLEPVEHLKHPEEENK